MTSISNFDMQAPAFAGVVGKPSLTIASESPADSWARERLLDEAFGAARSDKTVERLREGRLLAQGFALAAKDAGKLIGTLRMWHILAGEVPALLLGPLAVATAYRSRGVGRRLMAEALFRAASAGTKPSCSSATRLITNPSAFPAAIRFGFSSRSRR
jgi:predicted N-acetyltransferase YhbS